MVSQAVDQDYLEMHRNVQSEGLLEQKYTYWVVATTVAVMGLIASFAAAWFLPGSLKIYPGITAGVCSTWIAFRGHDVGHNQVFTKRMNKIMRTIIGEFLLGQASKLWVWKHNAHHRNPNHIDKDPDLQVPIVKFTASQIRPAGLNFLYKAQQFTFPMFFLIQAWNASIVSGRYLFSNFTENKVQLSVFVLRYGLYGWFIYLLGPWGLGFMAVHMTVFGLYNSGVFATNHKGMLTIEGESNLSYVIQMIVTARNVSGGAITHFLMGGLNYQIEHHLFPNMPQSNLPKAQVHVMRYCKAKGVEYTIDSVVGAYKDVFLHLRSVAREVRAESMG